MEKKHEMESPSAHQDCLVEAQEDSTSVEPEPESVSSPSKTMTTTTTPATEAEDDARDSRADLVCERLDEGSENQGSREGQLSDYPCLRKLEEEKDMDLKLEKETSENGKNLDIDFNVESTTDSLQESEETLKKSDSQNCNVEDEEEDKIEKKRSIGSDFLPIGAQEIRRVGVEISEEEATQMRNDVRRLSPVLVSLRERTLGEVFLSSQSCLFGDEVDTGKAASRSNAISQELFAKDDSRIQDAHQSEKRDVNEEEMIVKIDVGLPDCADRKLNYKEEVLSIDVASSIPSRLENSDETSQNGVDVTANIKSSSCTLIEKETTLSPAPSSPVHRHLAIVLNRVKMGDANIDKLTKENGNDSMWNIDESSPCPKKRRNSVEEECDSSSEISKINERSPKKQRLQSNVSPTTRSKKCELIENNQSPDRNLILKKCKVVLERIMKSEMEPSQEEDSHIEELEALKESEREELGPVAVIGKLEEDEEVVLTSSSSSGENSRAFNELDSLETTPSSPEEGETTPEETSVDVGAEGVDTETETETGSDVSSEVSPMTNIRELRDMASDHQLPCPEEGPLCCVEAMAPIMTRLEAERPEAYTEDSAESLTLATGTRDEVRSDGSDSGLGNEIPGDPGPAPAPESDSETSFLDRLPDDILSDKEKGVNQLDGFASSSGTPETPGQAPLTSFRALPAKSNLKRRLTDCMEGDESRSNPDEPVKKKRNIQFDAVTVYYFPRTQGFTCVPSQGGSTLGMSATHTHAERFSLSEHAAEQRRIHRAHLAQLRSERNCATSCVTETASSSEDPSDDTDEEPSDTEELDIDSYYFLQPVPTWQRRVMLRNAGVRRIDAVEKDECRDIRASREHCGCGCKGYCDPESCPCSRASVKCQVDRPGFPCGCTRDGCANSSGRIEFNPVRVRTHFIHTLMRLELEKKQREEEGGEHADQVADNQRQGGRGNGGSLRDIDSLGMEIAGRSGDACAIPGPGGGGGFTTLHYETGHEGGVVTASCQPEVPGTREDSLDLYAIRDDCYASEDTVDGSQSVAVQRKLHPEFGQAFQSFSTGAQNSGGGAGGGMSFQQSSYQDYVSSPYANLPSTSRVSQFQPPQFQSSPNPAAFAHYGPYGGTQDAASAALQGNCAPQLHQVPSAPPPPPGQQQQQQQQHSSYDATVFAQDEATSTAQYTNLTNSVQPMNGTTVVQQMQGKLESFSDLLSGRYSYYGEMHEPQQQHHGTYGPHGGGHAGATGKIAEMVVEPCHQVAGEQQSESTSEDCDENFGEIIKKSMVETVSA
ncbi:uncharacterized protein LOC126856535 isoform X2 [Cataglyphis hispanica]|nr:uncharacterized protein LOC126856535 isoform X2 [Cataglyphis hispanica]XP_050461068.1 uncharacterized protein LOC126856535 isoform X2 [Cataglyphis hispanica]XP_050461071.1 uncharacterized protein LOC126856535 isoform X2 [Cataglyphis hispanica]XP_050461072.1 uncharacterized protein LOC126856535 isoform X2 [Cataglyphis hispanica]